MVGIVAGKFYEIMEKHLANHAKIIYNQRTEGGIEPGTPLPFLRLGGGRGGVGGAST